MMLAVGNTPVAGALPMDTGGLSRRRAVPAGWSGRRFADIHPEVSGWAKGPRPVKPLAHGAKFPLVVTLIDLAEDQRRPVMLAVGGLKLISSVRAALKMRRSIRRAWAKEPRPCSRIHRWRFWRHRQVGRRVGCEMPGVPVRHPGSASGEPQAERGLL